MRIFEIVCWLVTAIMSSFAGMRLLLLAASTEASAPQYAAEAAGICAMVLVPFVFSRSFSELRRTGRAEIAELKAPAKIATEP